MKRLLSIKNIVISFAVLIALWQIAYMAGGINEALFPSPLKAWDALLEMISDGSIFTNIGASMYRFVIGYISAILAAVLLGLFLGWFKGIFKYVNTIVQLLRPISPMAWMPFIVLIFGIGDIPAVVIIFIAAFFPVFLSTVSAVGNIDPIYLKVSENFGVKPPQILWKVILPSAFPQIASGIHLALGTAWVFLVAGEMIGSQTGLGYLIIDSRNNLRADTLLATIIVIGVIGILLDAITRMKLQDDILRISQEAKKTVIFVTHDIEEAVFLADKVVIMTPNPGKIKCVLPIPLRHYRDRTSEDFLELRDKIFEIFNMKHEVVQDYII